jgi:hypothetical protein
MQIGFAARFDLDELDVETLRFLVDDEATLGDPLAEDAYLWTIYTKALQALGFFLVPALRTWGPLDFLFVRTDAQICHIYDLWHETIVRRDLDGLLALYAKDAIFETPAILVTLTDRTQGILEGKE